MTRLKLSVQQTASAFIVLAFGGVLSKLLGIAREMLTSYFFGASRSVDTFLVAGMLPNIFSSVVAASLVTVMVPVLIELRRNHGERDSWMQLASPLFIAIGLLLILFSLLTFLFAPYIVHVLAPGFEPAAEIETANMTRLLSPALFFAGFSGLLTGVFQSYRHFLITALAPLLLNLGIIITLALFARTLGNQALALGYLLGAGLQFLALLGVLFLKNPPFHFSIHLLTPQVKRVLWLWLPLLVASAAGQLDLMINRMVGSGLPEGAISGLNYAFLIYQILPSVVISAMGGAILPSLSEASAANDRPAMENRFGKALRITWWICIPAAAFLIIFAIPIVQLIFQRGAFDSHDTWITATSLQYYAPSLIPTAFMSLGFQVFYASKITRIPLWVSLCSIATSVAFNLTLVRFMDHRGLALALTLSSLVGMAMTLFYLRNRLLMRLRGMWGILAWLLASTTLVSVIIYLCDRTLLNAWPLLLRLPILVTSFIALYIAINLIPVAPMSGELRTVLRSSWSRLHKRPKAET